MRQSSKKLKRFIISNWNDENSHTALYGDLIDKVLEDVNSPKALAMKIAYRSGDSDALLACCDVHPAHYLESKAYYLDNLASSLVKKYPNWDTTLDPEKEAMKTFISCEIECLRTNNRLDAADRVFRSDEVPSVMLRTARTIASILGSCPRVCDLPFEFGPGASFSVKGRTTPYEKLTGALDVTPKAASRGIEFLKTCPGWLSLHGIDHSDDNRINDCITKIRGDRLSFVPKTAKTKRPIAIGPCVNVLLQKGIGSFIRQRLKHSGLRLNTAPERHRKLAQKASLDDSLATIDLSSASDTISYGIVQRLLPRKWFELMDDVRSEMYEIEGKWYEYHKFSAMGNGYTFELESLIFYAIAIAVCIELGLDTSMVSVFGDDIIIPSQAVELLMHVLQYSGFTVNQEKSFWNSPFRESCGGDFFSGHAVRGFYVKGPLKLRDLVRFRNYLYRTGHRFWLRKTWRWLRKQLAPYESFLAGPDDTTDDHIVFDEYDYEKPYNVVAMSAERRKIPRRWQARRVFMLYEAMSIPRFDPLGQLSAKADGLPLKDRYVIGISTRYYRVNNTNTSPDLLAWEG